MTKEQKDLLKKVICAMLPYGVKATTTSNGWNGIYTITGYNDDRIYLDCPMYDEGDDEWLVESVKPYLRPMSSMTEDEKEELLVTVVGNEGVKYFQVLSDGSIDNTDATIQDLNRFNMHWINFDKDTVILYLDWLNAHHFDYRGLIPLGLAIEVTEKDNPYKD